MANSKTIVLKNVRLAYVDLTPAEANAKKRVTALISKNDKETIALMRNVLKETAVAEWGSNIKNIKNPILDGDTRESRDEYKNTLYINAKSGFDVTVVNQVKETLDPGQIYAGCKVNLAVNVYTYVYQGQKGLSFGLSAIQFVEDGERLGPDGAESAFDILNVSGSAVLAPANPAAPVSTETPAATAAAASDDDPFEVTDDDGFLS